MPYPPKRYEEILKESQEQAEQDLKKLGEDSKTDADSELEELKEPTEEGAE